MKTSFNTTILLVESDEFTAFLISETLEKQGYVVDILTDGRLFEEKVSHFCYDMIICNITMPYMGGIELLGILRYKLFQKKPFILLSSTRNTMVLRELFLSERNDILLKPLCVQELVGKVSNGLEVKPLFY